MTLKKLNIKQPKVSRYYCSLDDGYYIFLKEGIGLLFMATETQLGWLTEEEKKLIGIDNAKVIDHTILETQDLVNAAVEIFQTSPSAYLLLKDW